MGSNKHPGTITLLKDLFEHTVSPLQSFLRGINKSADDPELMHSDLQKKICNYLENVDLSFTQAGEVRKAKKKRKETSEPISKTTMDEAVLMHEIMIQVHQIQAWLIQRDESVINKLKERVKHMGEGAATANGLSRMLQVVQYP